MLPHPISSYKFNFFPFQIFNLLQILQNKPWSKFLNFLKSRIALPNKPIQAIPWIIKRILWILFKFDCLMRLNFSICNLWHRLTRSLTKQATVDASNPHRDYFQGVASLYKNRRISGDIKPSLQLPLDKLLSFRQKIRTILPKLNKSNESKLSPKRKKQKGSQNSILS